MNIKQKTLKLVLSLLIILNVFSVKAQDVVVPQQAITVIGANGQPQQVIIPQQTVQVNNASVPVVPVIQPQNTTVSIPQQSVNVVGSDGKVYQMVVPQQQTPLQQPANPVVAQPNYYPAPVQNSNPAINNAPTFIIQQPAPQATQPVIVQPNTVAQPVSVAQPPAVVFNDPDKLKTSRLFLQISGGYLFKFKEEYKFSTLTNNPYECGSYRQSSYVNGKFVQGGYEEKYCDSYSYKTYTLNADYDSATKITLSAGMSWSGFAMGIDWDGLNEIKYTEKNGSMTHSYSLYSFFIQPQITFDNAVVFAKLGLGAGSSYKTILDKRTSGDATTLKLGLGVEFRFNNYSSIVVGYENQYIASSFSENINNYNNDRYSYINSQSINIGYKLSFVGNK